MTRRVSLQLLVVAIVTSTLIAFAPGLALAAEDLQITGDSTWRVNVEEARIDVELAYSLKNVKGNTRRGNTITKYYFDGAFVLIPEEAENIAVQSKGRDVDFEVLDDQGFRYLEIDLPSRLFYNQTRVLDVTFSLDGSELVQTDPVRVNPAHLTMWLWSWGDPGKASVRIEMPRGFELDWQGADGAVGALRRDFAEQDLDVWYSNEIEDPENWWLAVTGDRPSALAVDEIEVAGVSFSIKSWPGEPEWYADVTEAIEDGLPALLEAVGLDWPVDEHLTISQSSVPNRYGYGGWFLTDLDEIEIGERVDAFLVLHEISHAWFNDSLFEERWISEGLAEGIPAYVLTTALDQSETPSAVLSGATGALDLNDWADPSFDLDEEEFAQEDWAYNASFWIVHELIDEIGIEGLSAVLAAAAGDEIAYRGSVPTESVAEDDDWHRFLDLLEEVGGSELASEHFVDHVVDPTDQELIAERNDVRDAYADLEDESGWAMPIYVRQAMEDWEFAAATEAIDELESFVSTRNSYETEVAPYGFAFTDFKDEYEVVEESDDITKMEEFIDERRQAIAAYDEALAAVSASRNLAMTIGLNELPDPSMTLLEAHRAFNESNPATTIELAESVHAQLAYAEAYGQNRIDMLIAGLYGILGLLGVMLVWLAIRWWRRRKGLRLDRIEANEEIRATQMVLPALDEEVLDAMYLDDSSPTGHLSAYIAEAQVHEDDRGDEPPEHADATLGFESVDSGEGAEPDSV